MANCSMSAARKAKNDEFYTQISDIENEVKHYKDQFKDKVVYLNCDDAEWSNFWVYFKLNFQHLGLKKLISTHYRNDSPSYKLVIDRDIDLNGDGVVNEKDLQKITLKQNGDFRSEESVELLKEADIVVSNPPFSLFREYIAQLMQYDKKFLILGNNNAITYKEIFPLFKNNKMWLGIQSNKTMEFRLHESYGKWNRVDADGNKYGKVPAISWFTNMEHNKRNQPIILYKKYITEEYPSYHDYDAINVNKVNDIPVDYDGVMGVPITFLSKYNPDQFDIIGCMEPCIDLDVLKEKPGFKPFKSRQKISNGKLCQKTYHRLLISKK
tara:strand:+ start:263 stop:1237 length:975 start_codon:yes stop_codon:yes gene_type:complete